MANQPVDTALGDLQRDTAHRPEIFGLARAPTNDAFFDRIAAIHVALKALANTLHINRDRHIS